MKCVIAGQSLGVWCRIIHTLTQVGENEVYFDFASDIMTISSMNESMSTFSTFLLFKQFFQGYSMTSDNPEKVALPAKVILKPYRTQKMAKNHVTSEIEYAANSDYITIKSEGKSRASSTYRLGASVHDNEIQFECDPNDYTYLLKIESKVLSSCLANFTHVKGVPELALKIQGNRVTLTNSVTDLTRKDGSVMTEYNLSSHDFVEYQVPDEDVEYVFGFREFKMFTSFAEQLKQPVHIHFQSPLDPVVVCVKTETFESRLCLATRINDPFANLAPTPSGNEVPASLGSDGRISNVTSQSSEVSIASTNGLPQERNRNRITISKAAATPSVNNPQPPPAKRIRRTEAAPPRASLSHSESTDAADGADVGYEAPQSATASRISFGPMNGSVAGPSDPPPAPVVNIAHLVENEDPRNRSEAYLAIKRLMARPRMSNEEYLKTIPGHDIILCPDSDED